MKNILQYLETAEKRFPEKTAFADESESVSFTALAELSRRGGSRLISKGLYNEPVAVFMKKAPQVICASRCSSSSRERLAGRGGSFAL